MKKLQNNFTTPEQSKRLLELGVPANSADCYYDQYQILNFRNELDYGYDFFGLNFRFIPCWSVGRLIEILKICIANKHKTELDEIFEELEMCIDTIQVLVQIFIEYRNVIDFSKLELEY